ncbi:Pepsin [Salix suchowensis]|nr:Pepsin [Salix suchowensis]
MFADRWAALRPIFVKTDGSTIRDSLPSGRAAGPVVWDRFEIGGYSIENQAIAAVDDVSDEPLSPDFVGILGLALPMNSIIARVLTPGTSDAPDGQSVPANLFSITPRYAAPSYRFISITLSRPGSDYPPSLLSIGRHPSAIRELHQDNDTAKDLNATKVQYSTLVSERSGILFWKVDVRGITVWVDGFAREVTLARGVSGTPWPTAVIDSGVPLILTTSAIANGIYGALGIGPASDGQYTSSDFCIGLIQAADAALSSPTNGFGDMILGVPFMRSVYTVMAYDSPSEEGVFPNSTVPTTGSASSIRPRLGLLSLVDPRVAMDEFTRVRVAHQPLSTGGGLQGAIEHLVAGWEEDIGRDSGVDRWRNAGSSTLGGPKSTEHQPIRQGSPDVELTAVGWAGLREKDRGTKAKVMSEDELRALRYEAYMRKERVHSDYTTSSAQTRVNEQDSDIDGEMGFRKEASYERTPALTTEDHHPTTQSVSPSPSPIPAARRSQPLASASSRSSYDSHPPLSEHDPRRSAHADTDELGVRLSMVGVGSGNRSSSMDTSSPHQMRFTPFPLPGPPSGHSPRQADS